MNYFLVTSRGCTATTWLAHALDDLPGVACSHGRDLPFREETADALASALYRQDRLWAETVQRNMNSDRFFKEITIDTSNPHRHIDNWDSFSHVGNVHGMTYPEALRRTADFSHPVKIVNIVREPMPFARSYASLVLDRMERYPEKYEAEHMPRIAMNKALIELFALDAGNPKHTAWIEACYTARQMEEDKKLDGEHVPMENLTQSFVALHAITCLDLLIPCTTEWAMKWVDSKPENTHKKPDIYESREILEWMLRNEI